MPRKTRRRAQTSPWQGTIRLALVFALLIALNAYFIFYRHGTSVKDLVRLSEDKDLAALVLPAPKPPRKDAAPKVPADSAARAHAEIDVPEDVRVRTGVVAAGETMGDVLKREGVAAKTAAEVVAALAKAADGGGPRKLTTGQEYALRFDGEERLRAFEYRTAPTVLYRVERIGRGGPHGAELHESFRAVRVNAMLNVRIVGVGGTVETSLYDAIKRAGESAELASAFADLFAWDIDFYVDGHPGDHFRILVEKQYQGDRFSRYGRILAAEYEGKVGTFRAFLGPSANPPGQKGNSVDRNSDDSGRNASGENRYYDQHGEAIEKTLLKTPLRFVRVLPSAVAHASNQSLAPSAFHSVLRTESAHLGLDFPAPAGTPVWATTEGRVTWKGERSSDGQCVTIAHPGGMESSYMHLSRIAKGLEVGQTVRQKQVIGYVGMSGVATAPHLHFAVKMGGHFVDPLQLHPVRAPGLSARERTAWLPRVATHLDTLSSIDVTSQPSQIARAPSPPP